MTTVDTIVEAIEKGQSLTFGYHGFDRTVSPYLCGLTLNNEVKMLAWQTDGGSNSGVTLKLRYFTVADMIGPEAVDAPYVEPTDEHKAQYSQFSKVYASRG
ncbi:MAG: hypothetical protein SOR95_01600 [Sutterella sp.]|nr:hypothetical protein [Sutterella sp.]